MMPRANIRVDEATIEELAKMLEADPVFFAGVRVAVTGGTYGKGRRVRHPGARELAAKMCEIFGNTQREE